MEAKKRGEPCGGREEGHEAGSSSEKEAPRKVQSHVGDRMEEVEGVAGGEEWGDMEGRRRGHADRLGVRGRALRWGVAFWQGWVEGGGSQGKRMGSGQPADVVQASRRHPQRGTSGMPAALSWKRNTMGDERGAAN